jgi:hypothetical protein
MSLKQEIALGSTVLLTLLFGCAPDFRDVKVTVVPISVSQSGRAEVDLDLVFATVDNEVRKVLPDAYFTGLVFSGKCDRLLALRGKLILTFLQSSGLVMRQVIRSSVTVDTTLQVMSLEFHDVSDLYPTLTKYPFVGDSSVRSVVSLASSHISSLNLQDCDVTLTQQESGWDVRCGPLYNFVQKCRFKVLNGQIKEVGN